jgi:hypothetical protein
MAKINACSGRERGLNPFSHHSAFTASFHFERPPINQSMNSDKFDSTIRIYDTSNSALEYIGWFRKRIDFEGFYTSLRTYFTTFSACFDSDSPLHR